VKVKPGRQDMAITHDNSNLTAIEIPLYLPLRILVPKDMKKLFVILVLVFICGAWSGNCQSKHDVFRITVRDKSTGKPVKLAKVELKGIIDNRDIVEYVQYTDKQGRCSFTVDDSDPATYQVRATGKGMVGYYDSTYKDLDRSFAFINATTGNTLELWLTSDTLNHEKFWAARATSYNIDQLISMLKNDKYPLRSEIPVIAWEEIPALLAMGNDTSRIDNYPVSLLSSSMPGKCYLGIVSLWFVESARIAQLKGTSNPNERFPSMTPNLSVKESAGMKANSALIMKQGYRAYQEWWNEVKNMNSAEGCRINPLENTNLEWR
jgi:hypothetical protein